ncbi:MAG: [Fe-Fe] hydrogenase large subunit C-terminal domain-containing protein, partial [Cetobacterium sp.]
MVNLSINNKSFLAESTKTILEVAKENNIDIDTLCFIKDCSETTECGICRVEDLNTKKLIKACTTKVEEGMRINTASRLVQEGKKERVIELLNDHNFKCGSCKRLSNCEFLELIKKTGAKKTEKVEIEESEFTLDNRSSSISVDRSKCLKCGRCVTVCRDKIGTNVMKFNAINHKLVVGPEELKCFDETSCLLCGQCVAACPVGALTEISHIERVTEALNSDEKHVVVGMAPSVRTALGELFGIEIGQDVTKKIYSALKKIGFKKIFDVNFAADITIVEEGTELIERINNNGTFPMFTSCCPGWVRFIENHKPEYIPNLSTAKSPQQIFGAATKNYYPAMNNIDSKSIFTVSIMPCIAKKSESEREEMETHNIRDIDAVLTTRELADLIKKHNIDFKNLENSEADSIMGEYTGAGT